MDTFPQWAKKKILVLGCGNVLYGDDGFGPAVAEHLDTHYAIPDDVLVMDAGLSVRDILFDVALSDQVPGRIIVVDALDCGRKPGEVFELALESIPANKTDDFSLHQVPSSNLLRELRDLRKIDICLCGGQAARIPPEVEPGLTEVMKEAVARAARMIYDKYLKKG
jgi:coenzyme F420 hydrogenase subunit delta